MLIPGVEGLSSTRRQQALSPVVGEGAASPGEVCAFGTSQEDGPGTWETLVSPRFVPVLRRAGPEISEAARVRGCTRDRHRISVLIEVGRMASGSKAAADGVEGVGEPQSSGDVGELEVSGPDRAKAARAGMIFRRAT